MFDYALFANEINSTFVWLMQTWIREIGGKVLGVILTNQDKAMKSTITSVLQTHSTDFVCAIF